MCWPGLQLIGPQRVRVAAKILPLALLIYCCISYAYGHEKHGEVNRCDKGIPCIRDVVGDTICVEI